MVRSVVPMSTPSEDENPGIRSANQRHLNPRHEVRDETIPQVKVLQALSLMTTATGFALLAAAMLKRRTSNWIWTTWADWTWPLRRNARRFWYSLRRREVDYIPRDRVVAGLIRSGRQLAYLCIVIATFLAAGAVTVIA